MQNVYTNETLAMLEATFICIIKIFIMDRE